MLKVLEVALGEVGYLEKASNSQLEHKTANAGYKNFTKYAKYLDGTKLYNGRKNGFDWCDIFVDYCFVVAYGFEKATKMTFQPLNGCGAGCTFSMQYYRNRGRLFEDPEPGDQIFFSRDGWNTSYHTGLVKEVKNGRVYTIEGNTSGASGVIANGGGVCEKSYPISMGRYGRPDYSLVEEEEEVTYEQFKDFMKQYEEELEAAQPSSWSKNARAWAEKLGLIKGTLGKMRYKSHMTREEFAEVLYRYDSQQK